LSHSKFIILIKQEVIPDPAAAKPEDWEDSMDGTWEAPLISNPKCVGAPGCGAWSAPLIDNPDFKGINIIFDLTLLNSNY
jgi:hypothetical protein